MKKFHPKDLVAIMSLIFIFTAKLKGFDGALDSVMALILGYYFVKRQNGSDNGT